MLLVAARTTSPLPDLEIAQRSGRVACHRCPLERLAGDEPIFADTTWNTAPKALRADTIPGMSPSPRHER